MKNDVKRTGKQAKKGTGETGTQSSSSGNSLGNTTLHADQLGKRSTNSKGLRSRTTKQNARRDPKTINLPIYWQATITNQAYLDLRRILITIHPRSADKGLRLTENDFIQGLSTLIGAAAQAVMTERSTHILSNGKGKDGVLTGIPVVPGFWPPAFDLRKETENETIAREALEFLAGEAFLENA